ncbi:MAG: PLP-dependent aminotransferase family protein [Magnetospirillum sp.]|nr:PLP-dependent aminotransferase family protein [Magnetospirillum sp.]
MRSKAECAWSPDISQSQGPLYLAISDAIAGDIRDGRLRAGDRLPAHRDLALRLGVDVTTVTRAYAEARRRGLVDSCVGRGTFIRLSATVDPAPKVELPGIDMTMNRPPDIPGGLVNARLRAGIADVLAREDSADLLAYGDSAGSEVSREAGALWLKPRLGEVCPDRVVVCPGSQGALAATLSALVVPGDVVCCPSLAYPGLRMLGTQLGLDLVGLPLDADGVLPDAFEAACLRHRVKVIYCCPTLANPTAEVMPPGRRREIVAVARNYGVAIVEDDAYGLLPRHSPRPWRLWPPKSPTTSAACPRWWRRACASPIWWPRTALRRGGSVPVSGRPP